MKKSILAQAVQSALFVGALSVAGIANAGNIFITGHDSDEHSNGAYMSAGLDFIFAGTTQTSAQRAGQSIAFLQTNNGANLSSLSSFGWGTVSIFDADAVGAINSALTGGFGAVIIGSGNSGTARSALSAAAAQFATYFNSGGSLFVNTDEGFGQSWYDFVPSFGTSVNNSISTSGVFAPTTAGLGIGLTDTIVDADITHSFYTGVDTSLFTIFEVTDSVAQFSNNNGAAVAIGLRGGKITDGGFTGGNPVPEPGSLLLLGVGLAGLLASRRRNKESA